MFELAAVDVSNGSLNCTCTAVSRSTFVCWSEGDANVIERVLVSGRTVMAADELCVESA